MSDLQKIVVLCVIALVIIGGIIVFNTTDKEAAPISDSELPTARDLGAPVSNEEDIAGASTEEEGEPSAQPGTDAGMEFPTANDGPTESGETSSSMPVPAPGNEGVEEMVVVEDEPEPSEVVFNVTGENYSFSLSQIRVKEGDTVTINFESVGGFHDWVVDEFGARTERVQTGGKSSVTFVADKAGTFEYYCSVGSHRELGMKGALIVE